MNPVRTTTMNHLNALPIRCAAKICKQFFSSLYLLRPSPKSFIPIQLFPQNCCSVSLINYFTGAVLLWHYVSSACVSKGESVSWFSERCNCKLRSSEVWRCVVGCSFPDVSKITYCLYSWVPGGGAMQNSAAVFTRLYLIISVDDLDRCTEQ